MADKIYKLTFTMTDGSTQSVDFTSPQGEQGDPGLTAEQMTFLKNLMTSTSVDADGNFEVGKNLEVDGELNVNTSITTPKLVAVDNTFNRVTVPTVASIKLTNDNASLAKYLENNYSKGLYHHCIEIDGNEGEDFSIAFDCYLSTNDKLETLDALIAKLSGREYSCSGWYTAKDKSLYLIRFGATSSTSHIFSGDLSEDITLSNVASTLEISDAVTLSY